LTLDELDLEKIRAIVAEENTRSRTKAELDVRESLPGSEAAKNGWILEPLRTVGKYTLYAVKTVTNVLMFFVAVMALPGSVEVFKIHFPKQHAVVQQVVDGLKKYTYRGDEYNQHPAQNDYIRVEIVPAGEGHTPARPADPLDPNRREWLVATSGLPLTTTGAALSS